LSGGLPELAEMKQAASQTLGCRPAHDLVERPTESTASSPASTSARPRAATSAYNLVSQVSRGRAVPGARPGD
jgi:hypothetical protein